MTIIEIEERTGLTRANIRFYEKEGLIHPQREANGYRNYSEEDLAELEKIKLLRALELPLEQIQQIQRGQRTLHNVLAEHLPRLREEYQQLERAKLVCQTMEEDHVVYGGLDTERYLDMLHTVPTREEDAEPRVQAPIRRLLARQLDLTVYALLVDLFLVCFTTVDILSTVTLGWKVVYQSVALGVMWLVESVLLHTFGTTLGKWILGLWVTGPDQRRLSWQEARERTTRVLLDGLALGLPLVSLWTLWVSYRRCTRGTPLVWEENSVLTLKDERLRRAVAYAGAYVLVVLVVTGMSIAQWLPRHRGDLTLPEFVDNFNRTAELADLVPDMRLDKDGSWIEYDDVILHLFDEGYPDFEYRLEGERLVEVGFHGEYRGQNMTFPYHDLEMELAIQAFAGARGDGWHSIWDEREALKHGHLEDWETEYHGVQLRADVESSGYQESSDGLWLIPIEGQEQYYAITFSMEVVD